MSTQTPSVEHSIEAIRAFKKLYNVPKVRLAELAGIHEKSLTNMDDPDWAPMVSTLRKLEKVMLEYPKA